MPSPSAAYTTRPDLSEHLEEFPLAMERSKYIAHRLMPVVNVRSKVGQFNRVPIEQLLQQPETKRSPRSGYFRGTWKFEVDSYSCQEHGAEEPIDDNEVAMYGELPSQQISTERAFSFVQRAAEIRVAAMAFSTSTYTPTAVGTEWSVWATADPISDVEAAAQRAWAASGVWPNALVISNKVFRNLRNCADVIERLKYTGQDVTPGKITETILAQVFGLDYVLVGGATKNSAAEGQAASPAEVWSAEYALVTKVGVTRDVREPCFGRTFHFTGDGSEIDGRVESYRDEPIRSDVIRVRHDVHEKTLVTVCGALLSNITA
jgi:hypothetical protein